MWCSLVLSWDTCQIGLRVALRFRRTIQDVGSLFLRESHSKSQIGFTRSKTQKFGRCKWCHSNSSIYPLLKCNLFRSNDAQTNTWENLCVEQTLETNSLYRLREAVRWTALIPFIHQPTQLTHTTSNHGIIRVHLRPHIFPNDCLLTLKSFSKNRSISAKCGPF